MKSVTWQPVSCGSDPLFSSWYILKPDALQDLKSRNPRPKTETLYLQDRDETKMFQKTSGDRLETETFKTETTSLIHTYASEYGICSVRNYVCRRAAADHTNVTTYNWFLPGVSSEDCSRHIDSRQHKSGTLSSPNYPDSYPSDVVCQYTFQGHGRERVQISFSDFHLRHDAGNSHHPWVYTGWAKKKWTIFKSA